MTPSDTQQKALDDWVAANLAYLSSLYQPPIRDAAPEGSESSEETGQ